MCATCSAKLHALGDPFGPNWFLYNGPADGSFFEDRAAEAAEDKPPDIKLKIDDRSVDNASTSAAGSSSQDTSEEPPTAPASASSQPKRTHRDVVIKHEDAGNKGKREEGEVAVTRASSSRPKRTHRDVRVKHEDSDNGLIRCPKCKNGIQVSERGCNLIACRRPHGVDGWHYFCYHCRRSMSTDAPCMRCPERNDRESRATAKRRRNEEAQKNPIELSDDDQHG